MTPKPVLFVAGLALLLAACATSPTLEEAPAGAILEVENRTSEDLSLSVRGRTEAIVRSGARMRVRNLVPGKADVSARTTAGGPGAFQVERAVTLVAGVIEVWSILPDAAGGEALPPVPGLGALRVINPTPKDVSILVNGVRMGRIFAGAERRFDDIPEGTVRVGGRPDDGTAGQDTELAVVAGTEATWRFEQRGGELVIDNTTDEALEVTIDGEPRPRIGPGETWRSFEAPGVRLVQARSEPSRRPYEAVLELTTQAPVSWTVKAGQSALVIENDSGEPITVQVPGKEPTTLLRKKWVRFDDVPSGPIDLRAEGNETRGAYAARLELMPAQVTTWVVGPVAGSIRVDNRTARPVTVYTTIGGQEKERGILQPNSVALIRDLPRSAIQISAIATGVPKRQTTTIDLSEAAAATWVITSLSGAVRVVNERDEALDVFIDAMRVGEIPGRSGRTFTGVEVGDRLVESVGRSSGQATRERLAVGEDQLASVVVHDITAWVAVSNQTGETVVTRGVLADQIGEIPNGSNIRFRVRAGSQRLSLVGRDSGLVYGRLVEVKAGETATWSVALDPGRAIVWSRLDETAAATIDDRAQGTLPPDDKLVVEDLAPGKHRVQLVGLRSGIVRSQDITIAPGGESKVTFANEFAVLLVENRAQEAVEVSVDGAMYGSALGGSIHAFGNIVPGKREVELYFATSRRIQRVTLEVREGQRARVVAEAPMGVLVIDNTSRQDVRVLVDDTLYATVPADAGPTLVTVPTGKRYVRIERAGDRSEIGFQLEVRADSAIHVPVPQKSVRLVVVNRTDLTLTLFAGERRIAELGPRASEMFEALPEGAQRLFAKDADGHVTHEEHRRLHAGETATWVLAAP